MSFFKNVSCTMILPNCDQTFGPFQHIIFMPLTQTCGLTAPIYSSIRKLKINDSKHNYTLYILWKLRNFTATILSKKIPSNQLFTTEVFSKLIQGCRSLLKTGGAWDIWGCTDPYKKYFLGVLLHFYVTMF